MLKSGAAALASGLLSAAAMKIVAVVAGPSGVAVLQSLQQVRQTAVTLATANGQTALVQGASSLADRTRAGYLRTVLLIFCAGASATAFTMILLRAKIADAVGLGVGRASLVAWLSVVVILSAAFVFSAAMAGAEGRIGRLALAQVGAAAAMAIPAWWMAQHGWFVAMLALSAATSLLIIGLQRIPPAPRWWNASAAKHFFSMSITMAVTGLVGSLALMAVRTRIARADGLPALGFFDAAWGISMNHVTLILASMQTFYAPALARAGSAAERGLLIERTLFLAIIASAPVIAMLAIAKPWALTILYSHAFHPAAESLRWTLLGDYFKIALWILTIPIIATADLRAFLVFDLVAWGSFAGGAAVLGRWWPASEAAAIAFLLMNAGIAGAALLYARRRHGFRPSARLIAAWTAGGVLVVAASGASWQA
jgi:O-antigen/teichoic acid export membrane protein